MPAPLPDNEAQRLAALHRYHVLDTPPEQAFDDFDHLASAICQTPIALLTKLDRDRQWFKASVGATVKETPREHAFCAHTIVHDGVMIVEDALCDPRFADNPHSGEDRRALLYGRAPDRQRGHGAGGHLRDGPPAPPDHPRADEGAGSPGPADHRVAGIPAGLRRIGRRARTRQNPARADPDLRALQGHPRTTPGSGRAWKPTSATIPTPTSATASAPSASRRSIPTLRRTARRGENLRAGACLPMACWPWGPQILRPGKPSSPAGRARNLRCHVRDRQPPGFRSRHRPDLGIPATVKPSLPGKGPAVIVITRRAESWPNPPSPCCPRACAHRRRGSFLRSRRDLGVASTYSSGAMYSSERSSVITSGGARLTRPCRRPANACC